jgi:hypothetical protein
MRSLVNEKVKVRNKRIYRLTRSDTSTGNDVYGHKVLFLKSLNDKYYLDLMAIK